MRTHTVIDSMPPDLGRRGWPDPWALYMDLTGAFSSADLVDASRSRPPPTSDAYFAGLTPPSPFPWRHEFQQRVWAALQEIPYGQTESYGELAQRIGSPGGARAVGLANGKNPIGIIIPCHRVVGSGVLTGYGGARQGRLPCWVPLPGE